MWMTWREQLRQHPQLQDPSNWPVIDPLSIPQKHRGNFLRNRKIVAQVLACQPMKAVANEHGIDPGNITRLMDRCLASDEGALPALTCALIPGNRLKPNQRQAALGTVTHNSGSANAFNHLLSSVAGLKTYLDQLLKLYANQARRGQNLRVKNFHAAFIRYLTEQHWPQDTYPFTVSSLAYESTRQYFHERLLELAAPSTPQRVILPSHPLIGIFEEVQFDEHTVDCRGSIVILLNDLWEPVALGRITLVAARECTTGAVLGALIVLNGEASQQDLLALFQQLTSPWSPRILTAPGLAFPPGDYMPTQLGEAFCRPVFGILRFDNALIHRAHSVRDFICDTLGATLQLGIPKTPLARALIESAFRDLNLSIHRVPSTTGSHPMDEVREPLHHQKKVPIISLKALEDIIQVHIADMNQRPMANLGGHSPMRVMTFQMAQHLVPLRPPLLANENPLRGREMVIVHYSKNESRVPWVNFAYKQYRGPIPTKYYNKQIIIEFHRLDIRQLDAYSPDGEFLGKLLAPKAFQRFPHSLVTAKYIHKLVKVARLRKADFLGGYFDYLLNHRHLPAEALELIRISREFGGYAQPAAPLTERSASTQTVESGCRDIEGRKDAPSPPSASVSDNADESVSTEDSPTPVTPSVPRWHSGMVHRRRV